MLNRLFPYISPCAIEILVEGLDLMGNLDVSDLSHSSPPECCLWGWVEYAALTLTSFATQVKAAQGKDLPAQHPGAGSELGLCLQIS